MPYDDYDEYDDDYFDEEDDSIVLACEDCDYRWKLDQELYDEDEDEEDTICPMCGSSNVVEI